MICQFHDRSFVKEGHMIGDYALVAIFARRPLSSWIMASAGTKVVI